MERRNPFRGFYEGIFSMTSFSAEETNIEHAPRRLRQPAGWRLSDEVAHSIGDAILAGRMSPGERLIETRLCEELGVSRTTLREALLLLQRQGLVRNEPRRGTFVTRLSRRESLDLCRSRALLEAYAVTLGADRLPSADVERMQAVVDAMSACRMPDDMPKLIQLDLELHGLVMDVADSQGLHDLWSSLNGKMSALILSSIEHHGAGMRDIAAFHQVLLDALRTGKPQIARDAIVAHYIGSAEWDTQTLADIASAVESMSHVSSI
jgi:DNA-binding GntR family transcriptional regulator